MAHVDSHSPGSFSWIELATSDQNAAKTFYTSLLGWTFIDSPMGENQFYTMFQVDGRTAAATYTLQAPETAMGIPPHWNLYITVASADESAKKAIELGGQVLAGPFDAMTYGRMAVIRDPTGAVFCIWQPKESHGAAIIGEPGSLCWADLTTPDPEAAAHFYTQLFGWTTMPGDGGYLHIRNGESFIGGIPPAHAAGTGTPPNWMVYIQVADIDATTNKARDLGASICVGPMSIGNTGKMSVLSDPQGAFVALFELAARV